MPANKSASSKQRKIFGIPLNVWVLGSMMMLANISFVMVYSYSGLYLKKIGVPKTLIGTLEGLAEAASYLTKLMSGVISDFLKNRKIVMLFGYVLMVSARPVLAIATSFWPVFASRVMERLGNGIQATPRDAMVADVAPNGKIGTCYGVKRSLATVGSSLGGVLGLYVMYWTHNNYQELFWLACIPAFLAFSLLVFVVKEPKKSTHSAVSSEVPLPPQKKKHPISFSNFKLLGQSFWLLMLVVAIFMLARMGETFLILHAHDNLGMPEGSAAKVMIIFNIFYSLSAISSGVLSDRMNRYWFLGIGISFLVMADMMLATASSMTGFWIGVMFWGVQMGVTQNVFTSLIAETVPENLRGTGFGIYYIVCAFSAFFCDQAAGIIADVSSESTAFMASGLVAATSMVVLFLIMGYKRNRKKRFSSL